MGSGFTPQVGQWCHGGSQDLGSTSGCFHPHDWAHGSFWEKHRWPAAFPARPVCLSGAIAPGLETFGGVRLWGSCSVYCIEARDVVKHIAMPRAAPTAQAHLAHMSAVPRCLGHTHRHPNHSGGQPQEDRRRADLSGAVTSSLEPGCREATEGGSPTLPILWAWFQQCLSVTYRRLSAGPRGDG